MHAKSCKSHCNGGVNSKSHCNGGVKVALGGRLGGSAKSGLQIAL